MDNTFENVMFEFESIDKGCNGYITRNQLEDYAKRNGRDMDMVDKWFLWFDMSDSGYITMDEVCTTLGLSMRKQYQEKVEQKRDLIKRGIIPAPADSPAVFAAPPQQSVAKKPIGLMDGVDVLHRGNVKDGVLEECIGFVKSYPSGEFEQELQMARYLKEKMEIKFRKHWQVIVASSTIGCMVGHEVDLFMHFRYGAYLYIVFRTPDYTSLN